MTQQSIAVLGAVILSFLSLVGVLTAALVGRGKIHGERARWTARLISAQDNERALIARDLHDEIVPRLMGLAHRVGDPEISTLLAATASELRTLSHSLHPSGLSGDQWAGALEDLVAEAAANGGPVSLSMQEGAANLKLEEEVAVAVYRIAQAALFNAIRHSESTEIAMSVACVRGDLVLEISDNGVGIPAERRTGGLGLRSMLERAALVGGRLTIASGAGSGTRITANLPCEVVL